MGTPINRSVLKAFTLLQAFRRADEWLTSSELSRRARLPQASGYRLVQTLEGIGAVIRDARGRYRPGMLLLELSSDIVAQELWKTAAQDVLDHWAKRLDLVVQVGIFEDGMVTYLGRAGMPRSGHLIGAGMQFEAYCTGLGKMLLSSLPDSAIKEFLAEGELIALTKKTITQPKVLLAELEQVRLRGYAVDDCEALETVRCIAAPIHNPEGAVVAALSFSDTAERLSAIRQTELHNELIAAAQAVADRLYPWRRLAKTQAAARLAPACGPAAAGAVW